MITRNQTITPQAEQILASSQLGGMGSTGQGQPAGFAGEEVHKRAPHALARSHA